MPKVALADQLNRTVADVQAKARQTFENDLKAYRAGLNAMVEGGGFLTDTEAAKLIAVGERLGIGPERMSDDYAVLVNYRQNEKIISDVLERNQKRREPLPGLQAAIDTAVAEFLVTKSRCDAEMRAADAKVSAARQAFGAVMSLPDEGIEDQNRANARLMDRARHLFFPTTREGLAAILGR